MSWLDRLSAAGEPPTRAQAGRGLQPPPPPAEPDATPIRGREEQPASYRAGYAAALPTPRMRGPPSGRPGGAWGRTASAGGRGGPPRSAHLLWPNAIMTWGTSRAHATSPGPYGEAFGHLIPMATGWWASA